MIISKINTEIETFCMDSDFRQSYPLIVFGGRGYDLDTQPCLFVPLFCRRLALFLCDPPGARTQDPNIKSVVLYQLS